MTNHLEIIKKCRMQSEFLLTKFNGFIREFPQSIQDGFWEHPVDFSDTLSNTTEQFAADLADQTELFDQLFEQLSSFMQNTEDISLLLYCDQLLREYFEFRSEIANFLNICHTYRQKKNIIDDPSSLYHATERLCKQTEYFSRRCREIFGHE